LAITGAVFAINANMPWFWAPICAALSCAGGGMLKDIVINKEPVTFRGTINEEVAVVGALILVGGFIHCEQIRTFTGAGMVKCRRLYRISFLLSSG